MKNIKKKYPVLISPYATLLKKRMVLSLLSLKLIWLHAKSLEKYQEKHQEKYLHSYILSWFGPGKLDIARQLFQSSISIEMTKEIY